MGGYPSGTQTSTAFATDYGRPSTQVREWRRTWRPAWRRARVPRQALPKTTGQNVSAVPRLTVARQGSNQAIKSFFGAPQAPAAAAAITPRALAEPPAAAAEAAAAAASAPAPAEHPLAPPTEAGRTATAPADALTAAPLALSAAATSNGPRRNEGCRRHERPDAASPIRHHPLFSPLPRACQHTYLFANYHPHITTPPIGWGSPMLSFITG